MPNEKLSLYAEALLSIAAAEGQSAVIEDELFRIGEAVRGSEDLQTALSDKRYPVAQRQAVIADLLGGRVSEITIALVSLLVAAGQGSNLPEISSELLSAGAAKRNRVLAKVRSAIELSDSQKQRLAQAIKASTGADVEIVVIIDESVIGGLVTEIGDDVIDGSVRHRQSQLRKSFA